MAKHLWTVCWYDDVFHCSQHKKPQLLRRLTLHPRPTKQLLNVCIWTMYLRN